MTTDLAIEAAAAALAANLEMGTWKQIPAANQRVLLKEAGDCVAAYLAALPSDREAASALRAAMLRIVWDTSTGGLCAVLDKDRADMDALAIAALSAAREAGAREERESIASWHDRQFVCFDDEKATVHLRSSKIIRARGEP